MMTKSGVVALSLAALIPAIAAASQFHHTPGAMCISGWAPSSEVAVGRGPNLLIWQSGGESLACPIPFTATAITPITVDPGAARVDYMDANGSASGVGDIYCKLEVVTATNTIVRSASYYSCSTPGGCATGANGFTGYSYLTIADSIGSTANVVGMSVDCVLPGYDSNNGPSGITGVSGSTVTP